MCVACRPWPAFPRGPPPRSNLLLPLRLGGSYKAWEVWRRQYGKVFVTYFGRRPFVMVSDALLAREVTTGRYSVWPDRGEGVVLGSAFGRDLRIDQSGLVVARDEYWRGLRASWANYLGHGESLRYYAPVMHRAVDQLVRSLRTHAGEVINVSLFMSSLTMEVVGTTGFGVHLGSQEMGPGGGDFGQLGPVVRAAKEWFEQTSVRTAARDQACMHTCVGKRTRP